MRTERHAIRNILISLILSGLNWLAENTQSVVPTHLTLSMSRDHKAECQAQEDCRAIHVSNIYLQIDK